MHAKEHLEIMANVGAQVRGIGAKRLRLAQLQVGFAFSAFILIGANDGALGVLIPSMRLHYGVDKATIGLLFLFQTIGYLIAAFNSGLLVEKLGNRRFLVSGVASFLLGVGALSLMPSFVIVLIMMLPLGFGVAIIDAGLNTYIASMPRNAALLNYLHAFYGTGALLGPVIASAFLAMRWGWNDVLRSRTIWRYPLVWFLRYIHPPVPNSGATTGESPNISNSLLWNMV